MNWLLAAAVLALVFGFRTSDALANAYGIAVAGDMLVTTLLVATVAVGVWKLPLIVVLPVAAIFLVLDITFVSANVHKIPAGGWFPLLVGALALTLTLCWQRGRAVAFSKRDERSTTLDAFFGQLNGDAAPDRARGVAVYFTQQEGTVPEALVLNLRHNGVIHDKVVLLKVRTERAPRVVEAERVGVSALPAGFERVEIRFGFAEKPDVMAALETHAEEVGFDPKKASFFLGRESPVPSLHPEMPRWQERVYAFLAHNAVRAPDYFLVPPAQVVELGARVEM